MEQAVRKRKVFDLGIKTRLQMRYLRLIVSMVIMVMLVVGLTFYATFKLALDTGQLGRYAEARIQEIFSRVNILLIVETVVFALIAAFLSLKLTHRIAGPMLRIEKCVRDMSEKGVTEEIHIRKDDELQDLVGEINKLVKKLSVK